MYNDRDDSLLHASYGHFRPASGLVASADSGVTGALWTAMFTASVAASAYHGTRRNDSVGWGVIWGMLGFVAPVITPAVAVAQGFGKRKR